MDALTCGECRYRVEGECVHGGGRRGRVAPATRACEKGKPMGRAGRTWRCEYCGHAFTVANFAVPRCPECLCNDTTEAVPRFLMRRMDESDEEEY